MATIAPLNRRIIECVISFAALKIVTWFREKGSNRFCAEMLPGPGMNPEKLGRTALSEKMRFDPIFIDILALGGSGNFIGRRHCVSPCCLPRRNFAVPGHETPRLIQGDRINDTDHTADTLFGRHFGCIHALGLIGIDNARI
jgi:hypothetical protein